MRIYDLVPTNGRKSFNGKAKVVEFNDGVKYLYSYNTLMGAIDADGKIHRYSDYYSATTNNHVRSFFPDGKAFWNAPLEPAPHISPIVK